MSWRPAAILTLLAAADEDSKVQRENHDEENCSA
jgi:hypothetical protein